MNENVIAKECVIVFIFIWFAASSLYVTKPIWIIMVMFNCHICHVWDFDHPPPPPDKGS